MGVAGVVYALYPAFSTLESLIALSFQPTFGFAMIMAYGWLLTDFVNVMRAARDARTVNDGLARGKGSGLE